MVTIRIEGMDTIVASFDRLTSGGTRAIVRALNRGINSGLSVMVKAMASDTGLKQKDVRPSIPVSKATLSRLSATMSASLKRIPLYKFGATGPVPSRGRGRGVSYKLPGGKGRAPSAFIATMSSSGHVGVFARGTSKKRLPIHELYGPSLGHVFMKYREPALARAMEMFVKNFEHEMSGAWGGAQVPQDDGSNDASA